MKLYWHFLKRVLKYNLIVSCAGTMFLGLLSGIPQPSDVLGILIFLLIRMTFIACTAGFAASVGMYAVFYRHEIPLYLNGGYTFGRVIGVSWGLFVASIVTVAVVITLIQTVRPR